MINNESKSDENIKDLSIFAKSLFAITQHSSCTTKTFLQSLDYLDIKVNEIKENIETLFSSIEFKKLKINNLNFVIKELDVFLKLLDFIDNDRYKIMDGPKGILEEYIQNLNCINTLLDKYEWLKEIANHNNNDKICYLEVYYKKYCILMRHGENLLSQEFQNIFNHYSQYTNIEMMKSFIDFIDEIDENDDEVSLFIPNETLKKLEQICGWFLKREQQYELFDDKNQHCDILKKLKYSEKRNEYLKVTLMTYCKMSSLGFKKNSRRFKKSIHKIFNVSLKETTNGISSNVSHNHFFKRENSSNKSMNQSKLKELAKNMSIEVKDIKNASFDSNDDDTEDDNDSITNQKINSTNISINKPKPCEYIEAFADNLNFCLKLLKHENKIINHIFIKSEETCIELISSLTILVIDQIQDEFERFFNNALDFTKISNNGEDVVIHMIKLVTRVYCLKERTSCLQTKDLSSASKLLQFSMRLNETCSHVLNSYFSVVESGFYNEFNFIPLNCGIHEYLKKVCDIMRLIQSKENILYDSIRLVSELIDEHSNDHGSTRLNKVKHKLKFKNFKNEEGVSNNEEDESNEDIDNDIEQLKIYQRSVLYRKNESDYMEENFKITNESIGFKEDMAEFARSPKFHFAKFYSNLIEKLNKFLCHEEMKSMQIFNNNSFVNTITNISTSNNFQIHSRAIKGSIFLINNQCYLLNFLENELKCLDTANEVWPTLCSSFKHMITSNIEKALILFHYFQKKWLKMIAEGIYNDELDEKSVILKKKPTFKNMVLDSKKKRKEDFFRMLKEILDLCCSKIVIIDEKIRNSLINKIKLLTDPALQTLDSSGDLKEIIESLTCFNNDMNNNQNKIFPFKEIVYSKMFLYDKQNSN